MNFSPFGSVPVPSKGSTNFNLSHSLAGTFALGKVQPVFFAKTLPGSSYRINVYNITKLETLIAPAMQQVNASLLWFKVPERLVYKHFKDWYSGGRDGEFDGEKPHFNLAKICDYMTEIMSDGWSDDEKRGFISHTFGPSSLWHLLGLPIPLAYDSSTGVWQIRTEIYLSEEVSKETYFVDAMPFLAYWLIYQEYFTDQTLSDIVLDVDNDLAINGEYDVDFGTQNVHFDASGNHLAEGGEIPIEDFFILNQLFTRAWRKDYFTSALPTPQRGPEVKLNMFDGQTLDVNWTGNRVPLEISGLNLDDQLSIPFEQTLRNQDTMTSDDPHSKVIVHTNQSGELAELAITKAGGKVDMSGLSPMSIVAFRNLFKLQAFLEKNNVAGGRYIESILAHWGERVPDFTVQRPIHVRSTSIPVQIMEVTATANSSGLNNQVGDQGGRAKAQGNLGKVSIYTQEPSFIFGLYCVTVPPSYVPQGIPRMFQHITRFDEPWAEFQHIGEQAIKNRELYLYWSQDGKYNDQDFGYQQRYSEYKYMPDRVVGDFCTSLSYWHMARMFSHRPYLNQSFIECNPDPRIFAVPGHRPVTASFYFDVKCRQHLSKFSTPKLT